VVVNGTCPYEEFLDAKTYVLQARNDESLAELWEQEQIWCGLGIEARYCPYFIELMPKGMVELYGTILLLSDDDRVVRAVKLRLRGFEKDDLPPAEN